MKVGCLNIIAIIWSLAAVILNLSGVGTFAKWEITAWPWHWSCLCIFYWAIIVQVIIYIAVVGYAIISTSRKERIINSYAPEQRDFIRRMMK
jgi:hypothetical protein